MQALLPALVPFGALLIGLQYRLAGDCQCIDQLMHPTGRDETCCYVGALRGNARCELHALEEHLPADCMACEVKDTGVSEENLGQVGFTNLRYARRLDICDGVN